jgi:hypothetical protein
MEKSYEEWLKRNPNGKFHQFYVESICEHLLQGKPHFTLGKNLRDQVFGQSGLNVLNFLKQEGLKPGHVCVDYGCGSLRIGQHLIKYLNSSNFWGLDVTERFYEIGKEMIGPTLIRDKKPHLQVISPASLMSTRSAKPDFVISAFVIMHVPPEELEDFIKNIIGLCVSKTKVYISVDIAGETVKAHNRTWIYSQRTLNAVLDRFPVRYSFKEAGRKLIKGFEIEKKWLTLSVRD